VDRFEIRVVCLGQHEQCAPAWKLSMETLGVTDGDGGIKGAVDEEDRRGASTDRVKRRELAEPIPDDVFDVSQAVDINGPTNNAPVGARTAGLPRDLVQHFLQAVAGCTAILGGARPDAVCGHVAG